VAADLAADSDVSLQVDPDIEAAYKELRKDESLQFEMGKAEPPELKIVVRETRQRDRELDVDFNPSASAGIGDGIVTVIFWVFVGALALGALAFLYVSFKDVRLQGKAKPVPEAPAPYVPDSEQVRAVLGDVDALAAQEDYTQAVHELLFRAIGDIDRTRPGLVRRSLTSREIGRHPKLAGRTRDAFVTIAKINEGGWFGGRAISKAEFDVARAAYAQFGRKAEALPTLTGDSEVPA